MANDYAYYDTQILLWIEKIRAENWACTARDVASNMKISPTAVTKRLHKMQEQGIVTWTKVFGSLRLADGVSLLRFDDGKVAIQMPIAVELAVPAPAVQTPAEQPELPTVPVLTEEELAAQIEAVAKSTTIDPEAIARAMRQAAAAPTTAAQRKEIKKTATRHAGLKKAAAKKKPARVDTRTPEQIQDAKDRMAKVRAAGKKTPA